MRTFLSSFVKPSSKMVSSWGIAAHYLLCFLLCSPTSIFGEDLTITLLHTNDVHSRFTQTNKHSGSCSAAEEQDNKCYGGFARLHHKVKEIRLTHKNVVYLSGGDYYQGTVWYTLHKWRIISEFVNLLNHTALALGNHEFDDNIAGLIPFIDSATFPIIDCNIDATDEPDFLARQSNGKISKSVVITADNGEKIGIIGYTTVDTPSISNPGKLKFLDVVQSVNAEATKLNAQGVNILIGLGHVGFDVDQKVAAGVPLIDVVVGGHTNTFLYTGDAPDIEKPLGPYPFIVTQEDTSKRVPIVQAYAFGKYLGYLNLTFDEQGELKSYGGNPILLDGSVPQDPQVLERVHEWGKNVSEMTKREVGKTRVFLNGKSEECRLRECNLGNFISDAMVFMNQKFADDTSWSDVTIGLLNSGGIRGSIDETANGGSISMEDVLQVLPFQNTIDLIEIKGSDLKDAFEYAVDGYDPKGYRLAGKFLQVSGVKVIYDVSKPNGNRVKSIKVLCKDCREPMYVPLNETLVYKIAIPTYMATGGDGFTIFRDRAIAHHLSEMLDSDMLIEYLKYKSPVIQAVEGRVRFVGSLDCDNNDGSSSLPSSASLLLSLLPFFLF
ncbi:Snake venom 5'-nucleotidase [Orchesella cincta]|uniref:5'-nucleotidase n=1 Tax=Orchesella cincta TaxID=48709 RepID=A0A1D2ND45_ORCCI|nr:Snake venom 5'-nucleotidase [Orchesella cincta]